MANFQVIELVARGLLSLFSILAIGLAVKGIHDWGVTREWCNGSACDSVFNSFFSCLKFSAFVAGFALLDTVLGIVAPLSSAVPWLVRLLFDAFALLFLVVGGASLTMTIQTEGLDKVCNDSHALDSGKVKKGQCASVHAAAAFLILGLIALAIASIAAFLSRKGSTGPSSGSQRPMELQSAI